MTALLAAFVVSACGNDVPVIESATPKAPAKEVDFASTNRSLAQTENTQIENFAARRGWKMSDMGMGIKMMKTEEGHGPEAVENDTAIVRYTVRNIADVVVYEDVRDTVVVGRLKPTAGLDLALRALKEGDRAWVMLPSDMAYGVPGDNNLIKTRWILIYDLNVEEIKNQK